MPELTIRLEVDPTTRRRTIVVSYRSDPDALASEHEEAHRALVEKLLAKGVISTDEAATLRVERVAPEVAATGTPAASDAAVVARRAVERKE